MRTDIGPLTCEVVFPDAFEASLRAQGGIVDGDNDQRRFPRLLCRIQAAMRFQNTFPSLRRPAGWYRIFVRNVSRRGVGFFHSEQIFPREETLLVLPNGVQRRFRVFRCRRIGPKCFEVGGEFVDDSTEDPAHPPN